MTDSPTTRFGGGALLGGRRALVTGGASGIGEAVCRRFAAEGASVAVVDRDAGGAARVADAVGGVAIVADVVLEDGAAASVAEAIDRLGGLDILVNNAGAGNLAMVAKTDAETWNAMLDANLTSAYAVTHAALPALRDGGVVVNNASCSGVRATRGEAAYSAAKAGLVAFTQALAQEYGPGLRANCVSPGFIRTAMTEPACADPRLVEPVAAATPLGRLGSADEVADTILFLASDWSRFVTGQNLIVDGGLGLPQAGVDAVLRKLLAMTGDG